jgi:hypothetical protein
MQQYKIKPNGFAEVRKKMLMRVIPTMAIAAIGGIVIAQVNSGGKTGDTNILPFFIPTIIVVMAFSIFRSVNRQKKLFATYTLTIDDNVITRQMHNTPEITIYFHEVKEIIKSMEGGFTIKGSDPSDIIIIPVQVENYEELEALLNQVKPVITPPASLSVIQKLRPILSLAAAGAMVAVFVSDNKIVVSIAGILGLCLLGWTFFYLSKSKNIDKKTRGSRWAFLLVMIAMVAIMVVKLTSVLE